MDLILTNSLQPERCRRCTQNDMKHPLSRFFADMNERMQTKVVGMHLEDGFVLTPKLLEAEIQRRKREGGNVKGFLFCNPNNPLGVVYPRQLAIDLMEVCKRHKVCLVLSSQQL